MSDNVYEGLREFLDKLPGGYPATDSGVEIRILKELFTPEDAEIVMQLSFDAEAVPVIAKRLGMNESTAAQKLEDLAYRGLIFRALDKGRPQYKPNQFVFGIYEFQLKSIDKKLSELMEEYAPYLGISFISRKTQQARIVPVGSAIETATAVATYNQIRDIVRSRDLISVSDCICRKREGLLGNECDRPHETCIQFGDMAQYYIDNEMGRQITTEQALELFDIAEESALVISPNNAQEPGWICLCCKCCCGVLKGSGLLENPADYAHSSYQAKVDAKLCSGCGICLDRCQIDAIKVADDVMEVDPARCLGCGLCISTCPQEARTLVERPDSSVPPRVFDDTMAKIAKERGLS